MRTLRQQRLLVAVLLSATVLGAACTDSAAKINETAADALCVELVADLARFRLQLATLEQDDTSISAVQDVADMVPDDAGTAVLSDLASAMRQLPTAEQVESLPINDEFARRFLEYDRALSDAGLWCLERMSNGGATELAPQLLALR